MTLADRDAAIALLTSLSDEDKRQLAQIADPADAKAIAEAYVLANTTVDRSLIAQVTTYFAGMSAQDWADFAKALFPLLLPIL